MQKVLTCHAKYLARAQIWVLQEDLFRDDGATEKNIQLINKIDSQITEILTSSEKKCWKVGRQDNNQYSNFLGKSLRKERHVRCALGRESMTQCFHFSNKKLNHY